LEPEFSTPEYAQAEKAALQLIARAEQSVFGLTRKLTKRRHETTYIHKVIAQLCEAGLLDDRRYARLWLESRISRGASSPLRLLAALRNRGIDRSDANHALKEALDDEAELRLLERFVDKHQRKNTSKNSGGEAAVMQSLKYTLKNEGFSSLAIERFFDDKAFN
jgi:regulatory protein